ALTRLAARLPFGARPRQTFADFAPHGQVSALTASWSVDAEKVRAYSLRAGVRNLGVRAKDFFPGFSGLTGSLEANETGGRVVLRSGESSIDLPAAFPESPFRFDSLNAQASWKIDRGVFAVDLVEADFSGPDAAGSAKGTYRTTGDGPGSIDVSAALERADARAVWRYLPHVVGRDTRDWLRDSLLAGRATETRLILKGDLKDFPFLDERLGQFLVTVKAHDAVLDYAKGWPRIEGIFADVRFAGKHMTIEAQQGQILGARLTNTRVHIPDLDAAVPDLEIKGRVDGPTAEFLKFIDRSPVAGAIDYFTEDMRATGEGQLDLELSIPLDESKLRETRVAGVYRLKNNEVTVDAALPPLVGVDGSLRFSGSDLSVPEIKASLFGGPVKIRGGLQKGGGVRIVAEGLADVDELRRQSSHPLLNRLSGTTPYRGEIRILGRNADLLVESDLAGLASTLPEPFAKAADGKLPLRFERKFLPTDGAVRARTSARDRIDFSLGTILKAQFIRRKMSGGFVPERGAVAIGRPLRVPETGLALDVSARLLDLDVWRESFDEAASSTEKSGAASAWWPDTVDLRTDELRVRGFSWNDVDLSADLTRREWKIRIDSRQMKGNLTWNGTDDGRLTARLDRLVVERLPPHSGTDVVEPARHLPALDVIVDDFTVRRLGFGRLHVLASNDGAGWNLERIEASNPHGTLTGQGAWRYDDGAGRTQLSFKLDSSDVGGLLARLGYPGTVRAGTAQLDGKLAWNGAPTEIDHASLSGDLNLDAARGQFLKLDPGAAGKLLGLISLQNLPRRISLDFKDVFSEGLTFDSLAGKMTVQNGIMRTRRLRIDSPSARVLMRGEVDLARETQRLEVTVRPEVGDTAALGMAMVHPAAGVATWLANQVLRNPLGTMFAYDYRITGTWDDPIIEKLDASAAETPAPAGDLDPLGG
ncbi:MAG: TIGR02099 family protein, partial [Candidatus Accumulibacter sp.]|nr:TIGR02099 family protein [Accumulibacter sp.]